MQLHTKIYLDYFEIQYDIDTGFCDPVECTIQGTRCQGFAVDIHHIDPRGMGGNPNKSRECVENYIAGCRHCHDDAEAGKISKESLYDKQAAKMMRHLTKKINKIMNEVLLRIKAFFKQYGTVHHAQAAEYFKINLMGNIFVFWNCKTSEISKLEGRDLFDKYTGFDGKLLQMYVDPYSKAFKCTPEQLVELHDEIKLLYVLTSN